MTVVRRACLRMLRPFARMRTQLGEQMHDLEAVPAREIDPQAALERQRLVHRVHQAIARLDPSAREVVVLRDLEGLTGEEVCAALGLGQAAMKSRLHRARQQIRAAVLREDER